MFGPQRERPRPMCTSLLSAWDGEAKDVEQRVALAVVARSPVERLLAFKRERGWRALRLYSDSSVEYTRDYVSLDDEDIPALTTTPNRTLSIAKRFSTWTLTKHKPAPASRLREAYSHLQYSTTSSRLCS